MNRLSLVFLSTLGVTRPSAALAAETSAPASWDRVAVTAVPRELEDVLPAGARLIEARGGDVIRLRSSSRPEVGRFWRTGPAAAYLEETDLLEEIGAHEWRYVVPVGTHEAVAVTVPGKLGVERVQLRDVGYAWEVWEDELVDWGDGKSKSAPPTPPTPVAQGAWAESRAAAALLAEAGVGGKNLTNLRTAIALVGAATARPLAAPYYRDRSNVLGAQRMDAGARRALEVSGPSYLYVRAAALRPLAGAPVVALSVDGRPVAGGALPEGPRVSLGLDAVDAAAPLEWTLRIPEGKHTLLVTVNGGAAQLEAKTFRKRQHLADAISDDEAIDLRASRVKGHGLARADALRLLGGFDRAEQDFARIASDEHAPLAARVYAGWRAGELAHGADLAAQRFAAARELAAKLPTSSRDATLLALARARAIRAGADGHPADAAAVVAAHPSLWLDPALAPALAGDDSDDGSAPARLAAAARSAGPLAAQALRRAFLDRTEWTGARAALGSPVTAVLARDEDPAGRCRAAEDVGDSMYLLSAKPIAIEIPRDPVGSDRFRAARVSVSSLKPVLDATLFVDGEAVPVPSARVVEEHRIALAPGKRLFTATGPAEVFIAAPRGVVPELPAGGPCVLWRRRGYGVIDAAGRAVPVAAPGGAIIGLELRRLEPGLPDPHAVAILRVAVDGKTRTLRYRAAGDPSARPGDVAGAVTAPIVVELSPRDASALRVSRAGGGAGTMLLRPLVRTTRKSAGSPARLWLARVVEGLARRAPLELPEIATADVAAVRAAGIELAAATSDAERARLHAKRARLLLVLGKERYAEEDLRAAATLDPERAALYDRAFTIQKPYVAAVPGVHAYPLEAVAPVLNRLAQDPETLALARRVRDGEAEKVRNELREARKRGTRLSDGALALAARLDAEFGDPAGAAAAYAELAIRHPDLPALRVAEASFRLDDAARSNGPAREAGPSTRAYLAAVMAGDTPGAGDAMMRAADATRWRKVLHAERAAGSRNDLEAPSAVEARQLRHALAAPDLGGDDVVWLEPGLVARAVLEVRRPTRVLVTTRCAELRPGGAAERNLAADSCSLELRVDGETVTGTEALLPRGRHSVEVALLDGGLDPLAAVRMSTLAGGAAAQPLVPKVTATRWLADSDEGVVLAALGPTALRVDAVVERGATSVGVYEQGRAEPLQVIPVDGAGPARVVVPLAEERPYLIEIRPDAGRVAVAAEVREDRTRPVARIALASLDAPVPAVTPSAPAAGQAPVAPELSLHMVSDGGPGTITLSTGVRDGSIGERDTVTQRGGRYAEASLAYRIRTGDFYWLAQAFGRERLEGSASGGGGARLFWKGSLLRLEGGALAITQDIANDSLTTVWLDGAAHLRIGLVRDWYLVPTLGGFRRIGSVDEPASNEPIDPDVWSRFDADHRQGAFGQLRLNYEPFLDVMLSARVRATTNDDLASLDRVSSGVGLSGAWQRLALGASAEIEHRYADRDRAEAITRPVFRADISYGIWIFGSSRLSLVASGAARPRPDWRYDAYLGLAWDFTFGRGLRDFAPPESAFSNQLGPYLVNADRSVR